MWETVLPLVAKIYVFRVYIIPYYIILDNRLSKGGLTAFDVFVIVTCLSSLVLALRTILKRDSQMKVCHSFVCFTRPKDYFPMVIHSLRHNIRLIFCWRLLYILKPKQYLLRYWLSVRISKITVPFHRNSYTTGCEHIWGILACVVLIETIQSQVPSWEGTNRKIVTTGKFLGGWCGESTSPKS